MSKIRKNFYIEILKYADDKREFILNELFDDLKLDQEEKNLICQKLINSKLLFYNTGKEKINQTGKHSIFTISIEGKFKLLEYEELVDARQSSKEAKWIAIIAMIISAILAIGSILIQIC